MTLPEKHLQPRSWSAFRCIGADCEDTCCAGWTVLVDRTTYETYQSCDDPELGSQLRELVTINTENRSDDNYARFTLSGSGCPFLAEGLCSIQKKLGESYLSKMCATYPRVMNIVDDVLERSLDLSCPEAARIVLLDPNPAVFEEEAHSPDGARLGNVASVSTSAGRYMLLREVRSIVLAILQNRTYPLWQRLVIIGSLCDQLDQPAASVPDIVNAYRDAADRHLFDQSMNQLPPRLAEQFEIAVELIVSRMNSDFTSPRFLACYQELMRGLQWTSESAMQDLVGRYTEAQSQYFAPFLSHHEYMLEQYLVNYVHGKLFPFGPQGTTHNSGLRDVLNTFTKQYLWMAVNYAIVTAVLTGLAAFHKTEFGAAHVLRGIQACVKTFEHSVAFPARALEILAEHDIKTSLRMAVLLREIR